LVNFGGWWLASSLITYLLRPRDLPARGLALVYSLTGMFQLVGLGIFWGQPLPALAGFTAMGIFSFLFWRKKLRALPA
jgi:putative membrane protein